MLHTTLTVLIALVWLINGLLCKLLNLVPRHQQIVARILGVAHAPVFTKTIGVLEIGVCGWVLSGIWPITCAWFQILVVGAMNIIECCLARDLLLFGKLNAVIALFFMFIIYFNTFMLPGILATHPL